MLKRHAAILFSVGFLGLFSSFGCARATAPLPPAEEVVLVVNRDDATLQIIPVDAPSSSNTIQLSGTNPAPAGVSALDGTALVPLGTGDAVAVIDLRSKSVTRVIPLASGSGATGSALVDDTIGYVANPNLNTVTRVNYLAGDTASLAVGIYPQAVVFTRGKVFVLNGNLSAGKPVGPSWLSVVDPLTNRLATGIDSILMPGPGNALSGDVAQDGVLYVMNAGPFDTTTQGRLTLVDPVGRSELGNFGGFGNFPGALATNGVDKLYISSLSQGLMVFDLLERRVTRGAGNGVSIPLNSGVDVDAEGRIYALESGTCGGGAAGKLHILRPDYTEIRAVTVGHCALAVLVTEIPPLAP
jgi:hypothetical protein